MDKHLITGSLGLLILQVLFLLNSLGLVNLYQWQSNSDFAQHKVIGILEEKRQNVKRKTSDSIIWQDSESQDELYRYDSILTLDNSTAELNLDGDIHLQIHENTLIVLDPVDSSENSMRMRFYRGQLHSRNRSQSFTVGSGLWSFEAQPGADISLRSLENEGLELEVESGKVFLKHNITGEVNTIQEGKVLLDKDKLLSQSQINESLQITEPNVSRIYSHQFPIPQMLSWSGTAVKLRILHPDQHEEFVATNGNSTLLALSSGTYSLSLEDNEGRTSNTKVLEVIPAPKILYLQPLARDRIDANQSRMYSWYPLKEADHYQIRFLSDVNTTEKDTQLPFYTVTPLPAGKYFWSVFAYDNDGYEIPPFYSLPVYYATDPFQAPQLLAPEQRQPASEKSESSTPDQSSLWDSLFDKFMNLLLPKAHAESPSVLAPISFSWLAVEGADHYVIEISSQADFQNPEVITKVSKTEFLWTSYEKKAYYWRVAAGASSGRMGLFSAVSLFDVNKLSNSPTQDGTPHFKETPKVVAKIIETPVQKIEADRKNEVKQESKSIVQTEFKVGFSYWLFQQKASDFDPVNFQGLAGPNLKIQRTWEKDQNLLGFSVENQFLKWKPKNENELPYQSDFSTNIITAKLFGKRYGLAYKSFPVIVRTGLEAVEPENIGFYGISLHWDGLWKNNKSWKSELLLLYGDEYYLPSWENSFRFPIEDRSYMELQTEVGALNSSDKNTGYWLQIGIQWGTQW